jgi:phosphoribosylaminoimidazolecarboxamide formyltransferase/IMP cyclohydrolase
VPPDDHGLVAIRRALASVEDKSGLVELARSLRSYGVELVATGGSRRTLEVAGIPAQAAEDLTGIGSWFGGRIKTLHPGLLGGILAPRTDEGLRELGVRQILPIDLVIVNFYPFARHEEEHPDPPDREEFIDIGGITLARAAAKNHAYVTVVSDPTDYPRLMRELADEKGSVRGSTRRALAQLAFDRSARYDRRISEALSGSVAASTDYPDELRFRRDPIGLRYGENPHQPAAIYQLSGAPRGWWPAPDLTVLKGSGLSYTNLLDMEAATALVHEFPTPTAAVVKHATPCGVGSGGTLSEAVTRAIETDPIARYGCVVAVNRPMTWDVVSALHGVFVDLLLAPSVEPEALELLRQRAKIKIVTAPIPPRDQPRWEAHSALGRLLVEEADQRQMAPDEYKLVTSRAASPKEACALDFAWRVVRHAKSNAVVLAQGSTTVGIGSGQTSRVKAVELAVEVAGPRAKGAVLASDGFFPFADGVEVAGKAGISAILQPGGSIRDPEVIAMAERYQIAMYLSGWRVFRH